MSAGEEEAGAASSAPKGDPKLIGRIIANKFIVESFRGGGAMGAVYKARQSALEKNVAVKVLHSALSIDPSFAARFHREAKAASRINHPNSMRVIDFGEEPDGLLYIAMEYLEGRDLYRVIHEDWPLPNERIGDIMMQALAAIAAAHDMGVIHRDLKPENIMMLKGKNDEGKDADIVKVCDFGIAKITETDDAPKTGATQGQKLTTQGLVVGTPEYMSPEQARGEKLDPRSDLYSMGIILYQLLTGRTPFMADTALAIVLKHISDQPEPPSKIYPGVHPELEKICMKAIAKAKEERFQDARAMRAAIKGAIDGRPVPVDIAAPTAVDLVRGGTLPLKGTGSVRPPTMQDGVPTLAAEATSKMTPLGTAQAPAPPEKKSRAPLFVALGALLFAGAGGGLYLAKLKSTPATTQDPKPNETTTTASATPVAPSSTVTTITKDSTTPTEPKNTTSKNHTTPPVKPVSNGKKTATAEPVESSSPAPTPIPTPTPEPPPPTPTPPPPPVTTQAPAPPPPPPFNAATCKATQSGQVKAMGVNAKDLTLNAIPAWTACAQRSIKEKPSGPIPATVHLRFNDNRAFLGATCNGCPGALAQCVATSTKGHASVNFRGGDVTGEPSFDVPVTFSCD